LPSPSEVIGRLAEALAPGGRLVIQDYMHDGMKVFPQHPATDGLIEAVRASYAGAGADCWIAGNLPALLAEAGLELAAFEPHVRAGGPGSVPFEWFATFARQHLESIGAEGRLSAEAQAEFLARLDALYELPGAMFFTPVVVNVVAQRPR